ncbi:6718_t:CDS:2 [Ambispora gerdemannii]|uniref:6718_t:CDS:1 n=1 Tax=Ambispora gerdemannii TaxID=144530 RepID=A0A9N8V021_9GLOM|nr:6718_t:CDS:2 [Ambispora gerdemannii]
MNDCHHRNQTLARFLHEILPNSQILFQDDFFKPEVDIPIDPTTNLANWDCPDALDLKGFANVLREIKETGIIPETFVKKEDKNIMGKPVQLQRPSLIDELKRKVEDFLVLKHPQQQKQKQHKEKFEDRSSENNQVAINGNGHIDLEHCSHGTAQFTNWVFVIVDGFMLYWDQEVRMKLDVKFFVRASYETLKQRRESRSGYVTHEGYWIDPPDYFDDVVWPNYLKFHQHLTSARQERGIDISDLVVFKNEYKSPIDQNIERAINAILEYIDSKLTSQE